MAKKKKSKKNLPSAINTTVEKFVIKMINDGWIHDEIISAVKKKYDVKILPESICAIRKGAGIPSTREIAKKKRAEAAVLVERGLTNKEIKDHMSEKYGSGMETAVIRKIRKTQGKPNVKIPAASADGGKPFDLNDSNLQFARAVSKRHDDVKITKGDSKILSTLCKILDKKDIVEVTIDVRNRTATYKYLLSTEVRL